MSERPQTWHYGSVARWWAEFNRAAPEELAFTRGSSRVTGSRRSIWAAAPVGSSSRCCRRVSMWMDATSRRTCSYGVARRPPGRRATPTLYQQAFHELDLPRQYRTIYICDSFGIGGQRKHDLDGLRRCYRHLGARRTSRVQPRAAPPKAGGGRMAAGTAEDNTEAWPESGAQTGGQWRRDQLRSRVVDLDPLEQRLTLGMRAALWREDRLVTQEEHEFQTTLYFPNELVLMLAHVGFTDVEVPAGYSEVPVTAADTTVFRRSEKRLTPPAAPPEVAGQLDVRNWRQSRGTSQVEQPLEQVGPSFRSA